MSRFYTLKSIKTDRLEIRPYAEEDRTALQELLTNREIGKTFMLPDCQTEEEALLLVRRVMALSVSSSHFDRGIYLKNRLIGFVNDVEVTPDAIELGYVIHPAYQHNGYATEMLRAVIDGLFQVGFQTVFAGAFAENAASIRVMCKCGMKETGKAEDLVYHGITHHCYFYAIHNHT